MGLVTDQDRQKFYDRVELLKASPAMAEINELVETFNAINGHDLVADTVISTSTGLLLFVKCGIFGREPDTSYRMTQQQVEFSNALAEQLVVLAEFPYKKAENGDYRGAKGFTYQYSPSK